MKKIRLSTFETNSSSTHALCILPTIDFDKFFNQDEDKPKEEQLYLAFDSREIITYQQVQKLAEDYYNDCKIKYSFYEDTEFDEDFINDYMSDNSIYSKSEYNDLEYEGFCEEYNDITVFGYYGRN